MATLPPRTGLAILLAFGLLAPSLSTHGVPEALTSAEGAEGELTPEELKAATAELEKMKREKPEEYRQAVALVQMALGAFGYGTGPFDGSLDAKTRLAIRKYQEARQLAPTGDVDAITSLRIFRDYETFVSRPSLLPLLYVYVDSWDQGFVSAEGTWTLIGQESGRPVQTSRIKCERDRRVCVEATAHYHENFLGTDVETHDIERWDKHEIVTTPEQTAACVRYTTRIGRLQKSVTGLRLRISDDALCGHMEAELHLRLSDGSEVMRQLADEREAALKGLLQAPGLSRRP